MGCLVRPPFGLLTGQTGVNVRTRFCVFFGVLIFLLVSVVTVVTVVTPHKQGLCAFLVGNRRIMKLVPPQRCFKGTCERCQLAIAQVKLSRGKGGGEWQQASHGMFAAVFINQSLSQNHVTAAFAVNQTPKLSHAFEEF